MVISGEWKGLWEKGAEGTHLNINGTFILSIINGIF